MRHAAIERCRRLRQFAGHGKAAFRGRPNGFSLGSQPLRAGT